MRNQTKILIIAGKGFVRISFEFRKKSNFVYIVVSPDKKVIGFSIESDI